MPSPTSSLALFIALVSVSDGVYGDVLIDPPLTVPSAPFSVAVGNDGTFYVADGRSKTIQSFDAAGRFRFEIPNRDSVVGYDPNYSNMAVDLSGNLLVVRNERGRAGGAVLAKYSNEGELQSERRIGYQASAIAVGPDNVPYVAAYSTVWRVPSTGEPTPYLSGEDNLRDMQFLSDGRLITWSGREIRAYDSTGDYAHSFKIDTGHRGDSEPAVPGEVYTGFAATDDGIFLTGDLSGTVRKFSIEGRLNLFGERRPEQLDVGYGVPLTSDLYATTNGDLYAAMPDARVVERIGPERFAPDYVGVTRLRDRPPPSRDFYDRLLEDEVDLDAGWSETEAPTFIVPGAAGTMVDLDFHFVARGRSGVVFVYDVSQIDADPLRDPAGYFVEAIDAMVGFAAADQRSSCNFPSSPQGCEGVEEPNLLTTLSIAAGTEIGFLDYSGTWSSRYADDPAFYELLLNRARGPLLGFEGVDDPDYIDFVTRTLEGRTTGAWLLSSDPRANWGRMDQFVSFLSDDSTLIGVEDLNLAGESDAEFTDFMFRINARLIPTPEPSAAVLSLLSLQLLAAARVRRR